MADSRAPSVIDHHENQDQLSDGYLSDSAMDQGKEKKKKKWKGVGIARISGCG